MHAAVPGEVVRAVGVHAGELGPGVLRGEVAAAVGEQGPPQQVQDGGRGGGDEHGMARQRGGAPGRRRHGRSRVSSSPPAAMCSLPLYPASRDPYPSHGVTGGSEAPSRISGRGHVVPLPRTARDAAEPTGDDLRDVRWVAAIWILVAVFGVVTALWSQHVGVPLRDPERLDVPGPADQCGGHSSRCSPSSTRRCVRAAPVGARRRAPLAAGPLVVAAPRAGAAALLAYHLVYVCYRNLKSWDAFNTIRDDQLLRVERWIFLGHDPAVLLHDLFGQHTAAYVLMVVYRAFTYLVPLSLVAALVFVPRIREGYVFLASAMWVWVLGVGSYYLIPTLGPFASSPEDVHGAAGHRDHQHPGRVHRRAGAHAGGPLRPGRLRQHLGVREPARRAHLPGLADAALLRLPSPGAGDGASTCSP